jgi:hypothetical protein
VMSVWLLFFLYWINIQISHFHIVPSRTWSEPNVEYLHYFNTSKGHVCIWVLLCIIYASSWHLYAGMELKFWRYVWHGFSGAKNCF